MFCPGLKCPHDSKATKYPRKCFYEVQCWRGYLDLLFYLFRKRMTWQCWATSLLVPSYQSCLHCDASGG